MRGAFLRFLLVSRQALQPQPSYYYQSNTVSTGMIFSARKQWNAAAISFIAAGAFRSNGFLLAGFLIWGMIVEPLVQHVGIL